MTIFTADVYRQYCEYCDRNYPAPRQNRPLPAIDDGQVIAAMSDHFASYPILFG